MQSNPFPNPSLATWQPSRVCPTLILVILGLRLVSVHALEVPPNEVWVAAQAPAYGDGSSADSPLDGSTAERLEGLLEELYARHGDYGPGLRLRFLAGRYDTGGIGLRPNWWVEGAGMDLTVLRRVPTDRDRRFRTPQCQVILGGWVEQQDAGGQDLVGRDYRNLRVADLTLDANWSGLKNDLGASVKKASGLALVCREAEVVRVKVTHSGALGGRAAWQEVFPIMVLSMLDDPSGPAGYGSSVIDIHDCVVEGMIEGPDRALNFPYATGILVGHRDADPVTGPMEVRVHHNEVRGMLNGVAFGGAYVKSAVFEHNRVSGCGGGFNFDTGGNRNVIIRDNEFLDCIGGGNVVVGSNFQIVSNRFQIRYDVTGKFSGWNSALRIRDYTRAFEIRGNRIEVPPGTVARPGAQTAGIRVYGSGIGVEWSRDETGAWHATILRHVIADNLIDPLLVNHAVPAKPGDWMYLQIDGQNFDLSGQAGVGDGVSHEW
ncbi:MAG: right-handed parallel beta-helix repeat-containing protein [Verrucomicrobiales bacterium]|nr:right-handed parallel beta-helix repeat-containing protein [Verrucomicrobiales bacterium]